MDRVTAEQFREWFANPVLGKLEGVQTTVQDLSVQVSQLSTAVENLASALGVETDLERPSEFPWKFSSNVPANTGRGSPVEITREINVDGTVTLFTSRSSKEAQQAVGVQFSRANSSSNWVPRNPREQDIGNDDDYIGVDNNPIVAELNVEVSAGDELICRYINNDSNPHWVGTVVNVEEER